MKKAKFEELLGQTITSIEGKVGDDRIVFNLADGRKFHMLHDQECCEEVRVEEIHGDLNDLIGMPILHAEESVSKNKDPEGEVTPRNRDYGDCFTWTFYRLATFRGGVVIRWYGSSNGYYSESVDCYWVL